ncbi:uncharacterized protein FA14DRAFT_162087 [Meira miltonrushii]|uniref:Sister chromatid cohesion protein n=1 Tax=Meira miltonrushii TaxID=1280837 RepID=A0A316V8L2_9BASI|nr:uncharacterized protein FA14DRAFT_162087 [Meira miltonrushii]PWN32821.1 hypothetical protein FA14DRAFT_162087 [Meira miltonrushii]
MPSTSKSAQRRVEVIEVHDSSAEPTVDSDYTLSADTPSDDSDDIYVDAPDSEDEDEYDAGSEEITLLPTRRSQSLSPSKSSTSGLSRSSRSAASSQGRTPYERMMECILDILEADDELPETEGSNTQKEIPQGSKTFFHYLNSDVAVLRPDVLLKINALLRQYAVHIPSSERRSNDASGSSNPSSTTSDFELRVEPEVMSRLLKILHRSIADQESIDPFASSKKRAGSNKVSKDHKKKRARLTSSSPTKEAHTSGNTYDDDEDEHAHDDISSVAGKLSQLVYAGTAAHCAFTILSSNIVDDSLRCEEIMLPYMHTLRLVIQRCFLPFVQACVGTSSSYSSLTLNEIVQTLGASGRNQKRGKATSKDTATIARMDGTEKCRINLARMMETLQNTLSQLQALSNITSTWKISEPCLAIVAGSILPIFSVPEPEANPSLESLKIGKAAWASLRKGNEKSFLPIVRAPAFNALYGIFQRCDPGQHTFIVNSILDHITGIQEMSKNTHRQYGLENGKSIHSISALMIRLVQSFNKPVQTTEKSFDQLLEMSQESVASREEKAEENAKVYDTETMRKQLDGPRNLARLIAEGLLQRIKQKKAVKTGAGAEVCSSTMLEWLSHDLLETVFLLKWPGASLILSQMCRLFMACYEEKQTSPELRGIAIEFLGQVAAHMQASQARLRELNSNAQSNRSAIDKLNMSIDSQDHQPLLVLEEAYSKLILNLRQQSDSKRNRSDGPARFLEAQWGVELAYLHRKIIERLEVSQAGLSNEHEENGGFGRMVSALDDAFERCSDISSDTISHKHGKQKMEQDKAESVQQLFESVVHTFNYMIPCESLVDVLLDASGGPVASNRGKALRALGNISHADQYFLQNGEVRLAIQRCLLDESVNVRDNAVGLLGKFVLNNPNYIEPLLPSLKAKIEDTGLLVRKRVLRLMGDIYHKTQNETVKSACAIEIVRCVHDEEQSIQDLAISIISGLWFSSVDQSEATKGRKISTDDAMMTEEAEEGMNQEMIVKIASLSSVADGNTGRAPPLEVAIRRLLDDGSTSHQTKTQLYNIVDTLCNMIGNTLTQPSEQEVARYGRTLTLLVRVHPESITVSHSKLLLPCIRPCSTVAELSLLASLLSVYTTSLPKLPKIALSFAQQLQDALRPLISQPSPHLPILSELMQCYGAVISHHTHDYAILVKTLQQCHRLLCGLVSKARSRKVVAVADRNDAVIIRLTALLVESVDFDRVRNREVNMAPSIDVVTRRSIKDEIVTLFLRLFENSSFVPHALNGIRFMARGFPDLLTRENVRERLSHILSDGNVNEKAIVVRALADVLVVDEGKHTTKAVQAGFGELVGNTESSANPISFEIVQTYLDVIVPLVHEPELQACILEIIQHIIMRGMCHPMQCLPCLVSLETQIDVPTISLKAQQLHKNLVQKTGSNISFRYAQCAKSAWEMHVRQRNGDAVLARGAISHRSVLQPWYDIILDHQPKQARMDILAAFIKAFDVQPSTSECSQSEVQRARFMAEAISVLDFKMMDEVQLILDNLQEILNLSGEQVRVFAMEEIEVDGEDERDEDELDEEEIDRVIAFGRMSMILSFAYLLRYHLMEQYGISESRSQNTSATAKASTKVATRKFAPSTISWRDLPRATQPMSLSYKMAKQELTNFDNLFSA